jgi:hypothetical protein
LIAESDMEFMRRRGLKMRISIDLGCRFPFTVNLHDRKGRTVTVEDFALTDAVFEALFQYNAQYIQGVKCDS